MLIQDVERRTNLDRATIRFYEKEGIFIPQRSENGYRSYSDADVDLLLKVKLLRQLGISLHRIKCLQQGSDDFSQILQEQIKNLEERIQADTFAMIVCKQMQRDDVDYATLDASYYLNMLSNPRASISDCFNESVKRECHPWRRYFARYLDYRIIHTTLLLLLVVILRIRPFSSYALRLLSFGSHFIAIPILAALLHYFGTTPGKWAMGIQLENINGGRLSGGEALYREGKIIWHGLGFFIPILDVWRNYRSYKDEIEGKQQVWNEDTEIIYCRWTAVRKIAGVVIFIICFLVSLWSGFDTIMPAHRGKVLTMDAFVSNYHDYELMFGNDNTMILAQDGTWVERTNTDVAIIQIGNGSHERKNFQYVLKEDGSIQSISFCDTWEDINYLSVFPDYCFTALYTVTASRPGVNASDLMQLEEQIHSEFGALLEMGGVQKGRIEVSDVTFTWTTELPDGEYVYDGAGMIFDRNSVVDGIISESNKSIPYKLEFAITIG